MTPFAPLTPLATLAAQLDSGACTSRALLETCLERIDADAAAGGAAFIAVDPEGARASADAQDALRRTGVALSPLAGLPISIKDLFDIRGQVTRAGSVALADARPATQDAAAVARLRQAGAVLVGRTNMSEFAFSGLGVNPHYGTPLSPWHPDEARLAGGSSSGAGVSVARGMAAAALGTDTGGSIRIPAAFCGLTGFKPTARRVPGDGAFPLSPTLDSFGPLAPRVACCALLDALLAGAPGTADDLVPPERTAAGLRLAVLRNVVQDDLDPDVAAGFAAALTRLSAQGATLIDIDVPAFGGIATMSRFALPGIEAFAAHRHRLAGRSAVYDPRVLSRILKGESASAADYLDLLAARAALIDAARVAFAGFDAVLMPSVAVVPPRLAAVERDDAAFTRVNALVLRNPTLVNLLDGCALTIPCGGKEGETSAAPVGLGVFALANRDRHLLAMGRGIERAVRR
ncbi:amidase [Robbsia sp. Bb-Pol-6]|uniref:Amidase n=1 Tax=Robbsia betulipollinis TaxID=2981849 RepID=A0ABT3ZGU1_9BURK|nr:amidase [Robbsia betulipollinis]MCY0385746.1 amidase [Robbsia betulipollinis]